MSLSKAAPACAMTYDLFGGSPLDEPEQLGEQAWVYRGLALPVVDALCRAIAEVTAASAFRHLLTPGGYRMSVAMTNCGRVGWVSDRSGYRYSPTDPLSRQPWPNMPECFAQLAHRAAAQAGFEAYEPDACLINRYLPGTRLSLHQDKDENDAIAPIVSVSLGMTATFLFGGLKRQHKSQRVPVYHGDVAVWGGGDRLRFHGVLPLKDQPHPQLGSQRLNLTFRKVF